MENILTFTGIIIIIFGILQIILFFKLWGMTNDIRDIRDKYLNAEEKVIGKETTTRDDHKIMGESKTDISQYLDFKFKPGDLVVLISTGKQMRIKAIKNGKYSCYSQGGMVYDGEFEETEIKAFGS